MLPSLGAALLPAVALLLHQSTDFDSALHGDVSRSLAPIGVSLGVGVALLAAGRLTGRPRGEAGGSRSALAVALLVLALPALALGTWILASPRPHEGVHFGFAVASLLPLAGLVAWVWLPKAWHQSLSPATIGLAFTASFVSASAVEVTLRRIEPEPPRGMPSVTAEDRSYWTYRPGASAVRGGVHHRFNALGLRGPEPGAGAGNDAVRVLVLGDSIPFGPGIPEERVFPWLAGRLLERGSHLERPVEVVNASLPGFSTEQIRSLYVEHLGDLPHEVVVLVHYIDDVNRELQWRKNDRLYTPAWPEWMQDAYYQVRLWRRLLVALDFWDLDFQLLRRRTIREAWSDALERIDEVRLEAASRGARLAIFNVPRFKWRGRLGSEERYRSIAQDRQLEAWCRDREVPYLSLLPALLDEDIDRLRVSPGDVHFNVRGHAVAARELRRFLEQILAEDS